MTKKSINYDKEINELISSVELDNQKSHLSNKELEEIKHMIKVVYPELEKLIPNAPARDLYKGIEDDS